MLDDLIAVEVVVDSAVIVVSVRGEIDMDSAPRLAAELELVEADRSVVVDMAGVQFIDSTGLNVIRAHYTRMREAGGSLRIRRPSAPVSRLLCLTSCEHLVEVDGPGYLRPHKGASIGWSAMPNVYHDEEVTDDDRALIDAWAHLHDMDHIDTVVVGSSVVALHAIVENVGNVGFVGTARRHGDIVSELNEALRVLRKIHHL